MTTSAAHRTPDEQQAIDHGAFPVAMSAERAYQRRKWGGPAEGHVFSPEEWALVLAHEFGHAIAQFYAVTWGDDPAAERRLRRELVQVATVCQAICEELPLK